VAKDTPAQNSPIVAHRGERILAFMIAAAIGLSILCFIVVIIATAAGIENFGTPPWPTVIILPAIGLPIGLVLMIVLIIVSGLRRGREARDAHK
jgi:TRAP-type C4-dicarboxylate transport system permease small subunit